MKKISVITITALTSALTLGAPLAANAAAPQKICLPNGNVYYYNSNNSGQIQDILGQYGVNWESYLNDCIGNNNACSNTGGNYCPIPDDCQPENCLPDNCYPDSNCTPETEIPETNTPETEVPETPETNAPETETPGEVSYAQQVVELVNKERAKEGLKPLTLDTKVEAAANVRANEIEQVFSHTRPNGSSFSTVLKEMNVDYRGAGENIAWGQTSPEKVMEAWMNSSGHRANILNKNYTKIGVGYQQNANGTNYWTQLFTY